MIDNRPFTGGGCLFLGMALNLRNDLPLLFTYRL